MLRFILVAFVVAFFGCGENADHLGVGAQCESTAQCNDELMLVCLNFKGGYCGAVGCTRDLDCPELSKCVAHTDGMNYCFRTCIDKPECNANRDVANEANCSSSVTFVEPNPGIKACVPPSA